MASTVKLLTMGRSQLVQIPIEFAFEGVDEVSIRKIGNKLILKPVRKTWTSFGTENAADVQFMKDRPNLMDRKA